MIKFLRKRGRYWYGIIGTGAHDRREISLRCTLERVARKKLDELAVDRELEVNGLISPKSIRDAEKCPLDELFRGYLDDLQSLDRAALYVSHMKERGFILMRDCSWRYLRDIKADGFETWRKAKLETLSRPTINQYLQYFSAFLNWLVDHERLIKNPLVKVRKAQEADDHRFTRRAYTEAEISRLLAVLPRDLVAVVITGIYTGLRRGELEKLQWGDVCLDEAIPCLHVRAATTKNHKHAVQPLGFAAPILAAMRPPDAKPNTPVWGCLPRMRDFKLYWEQAGIVYEDEQHRRADFHSLRTTLGTMLTKHGAGQRVTQELLRHSDPRLTAGPYTDVSQLNTGAALDMLPDFTKGLPHMPLHEVDTVRNNSGQSETLPIKNGGEQVPAVVRDNGDLSLEKNGSGGRIRTSALSTNQPRITVTVKHKKLHQQ